MRHYLSKIACAIVVGSSFSVTSASTELEGRAYGCDRTDVTPLMVNVDGHALLCSGRNGMLARVRAEGLVPNDVYTVWWVYIDDPASCIQPGQCALEDFGGDNPLPVFGRMDSLVADSGRSAWFGDKLRGLTPSPGSQVWLLIFGHGPADRFDNRHLARQLLTPEDPHAGAPHLGNVVEGSLGFPAAVAVFGF